MALALIIVYLGGMIACQRIFYFKKEIRKDILIDFKKQTPVLDRNKIYYFADLPIREDEIKYMLYLWYGTGGIDIKETDSRAIRSALKEKNAAVFDYKNSRLVKIK